MIRHALVFVVVAPFVLASTNINGTISSNTIWNTSGSPYVVSQVTVPGGVTLTIAAGVIVKMSANALVQVPGGLVVNGTASQPVVFTSIKDDSVGGDTNGDGNASSPAAGDWAAIWVITSGTASFNHAIMRFGGASLACCFGPSTISFGPSGSSGSLTIANSTLTDSVGSAVFVEGGAPTISASTFARDQTGITIISGGVAGTISNNVFTTTAGSTALSVDASFLGTLSGNTSSGTGTNAISITGNLSSGNATWGETHMPYNIVNATVSAPGVLTIAAGVIVKMSANALVQVPGGLVVNGTASQPVVFTSIKDDSVGGDTNGDGNASSPAAGDWAAIWVITSGTASFNHAIMRFGGASLACCFGPSTISFGPSGSSGSLTIANSTLTDSVGSAVFVEGGAPTISASTFARDQTGITIISGGVAGTISNNVFTTTAGSTALSVDASFLGTLSGNTSSGTGTNAISITGNLSSGNATWGETHMPYNIVNATVSAPGVLTIAAGVIVKMSANALVQVPGGLVVNGTASQPVVFTSIKDDSVGGDTNGDGNASSPAAGDWAAIWVITSGTASFNHAIMRFGGASLACCFGPSTISFGPSGSSGSLTIANSTLTDSVGSAVFVEGGAPTISASTFARDQTGITIISGGVAGTISNNVFTTTAGSTALSVDASFLGTLSGNTSSGTGTNAISITGNLSSGNATWGETHMPYNIVNATVSAPGVLTIAAGVIVKMSANALVQVPGGLVVNGTASQPVVFTSIKDDSVGGDTNGDGNASSPAAGDWAAIWVITSGTASFNHAIMRFGGASLACCFGPSTISFGPSGSSGSLTIANSTLTDSVGSAVFVEGGAPTISASTFARNSTGISVSGGATPHVHNNSFQLDSSYGVLNADCSFNGPCSTTPTVDATNNYWGSPSGPWLNPPPGLGDRVSYHVNYIPFLGQPGNTGTPPPMPTLLGGSSATNPSAFTFEPINTATGNYYLNKNDISVPGNGIGFTFSRSYNSQDGYSGPLGTGWTHSYNIILTLDPTTGDVSIKEADGHMDFYSPAGGGSFVPQIAGLFDTLQQNADNSFTLTRKNQVKLNFSPAGQLASVSDRNGNTQILSYGSSGNLISVVDTSGRTFTFAYDGTGHLTGLSDPIGRSWQYSYDANGNLISARDTAGGLTQYTYDANHRMLSAIDPRGVTFLRNTYDILGRVAAQTNGRGGVTTLAYNSPVEGTTTFTDPLGNATQDVYDAALRLITVIDAKGNQVSYTYDGNNNRTSITNQNGNTLSLNYNALGNPTSITDPLGNVQAFTYDGINDLLTATNPKGATTAFSYDSNGNLLTIKDAFGDTTRFGYNPSGLLTSKTDARGNATSYAYDAGGDLTHVTNPLSDITTLTYDGLGRLLTATDPNGHTSSVVYDVLNRIIKTTDALNHTTQFSYDAIGNLLKITDANGNATSYAYDATNNLTSVTDALGHLTSYGYDANNNRTGFTNAKGNTTSYSFDALNRLSKITDPLSFTSSYAYDAVGNTIATTDANGKTNQYVYDVLNRLLKGSYADGSSVSFSYDKDGNRSTMVDSRGTTTYSYDALDRVLSVTSPSTATVQYGYDAVGNRTTLGYPDSRTVQYQYDALNRLAQVTDWDSKATHYTYDPASNLTGIIYPNGASSSHAFDAANRLLNTVNRSGSNVLSSFAYLLDSVGNRLQVTSAAGGTTEYGYDALYRLTSWTTPSGQPTQYTYDPAGNRLLMVSSAGTTSYIYDADDRMLSAGSTSYGYDKNGNQITKTTGSTTVSYSYDALNRLIAASGGGINSEYQYDGDGNRVAQTVPTGTYQYFNDTPTALPVVLSEAGPDGNIDYLYGLSIISETSAAFQYFYQSDGLGSTESLTDQTGALKANYAYDPWGKLLVPIDPLGTKNKYKFTGEPLDPGTGLYFLRTRYYDPAGRFLGRDPFGGFVFIPNSLNRYEYTLDNPTRFTDPTGFSAIDNELSPQQPAIIANAVQLAGPIFQLSNLAPGPEFTRAAGNFILDQTLGDFLGLAKQLLISSYNLVTNPSPETIVNETHNVVESVIGFVTNKTVGLVIGIFNLLTVPEIAVAPSTKP